MGANHPFRRLCTMFLTLAVLLMILPVASAQSQLHAFRLLSSVENEDMQGVLEAYAKANNISLSITYQTTMDMMATLNSAACAFDGVWLSNSIWLYMLDGTNRITDSKILSVNPVVFGIAKSKAQALGFTDREVLMGDIVNAVKNGELKFIMPSATQTNSGASAYLGFLSALSGNPEVLTLSHLRAPALISDLSGLLSGVARNSGSEAYLAELYDSGDYDAMVNYEFMMIGINKHRVAAGKEPLYLIYPVDGVSLSDSPFAYIDKGDEAKKEVFLELQAYLLGSDAQKQMAKTGRRTGYGGLNPYGDTDTFNPDWGIDIGAYLSPIKYPSAQVIREAFLLYQEDLKKPSVTIFCLDMSGSMMGKGYDELTSAMEYILTPERAARDFIQFGRNDKIILIPFDSYPHKSMTGTGADQAAILRDLNKCKTGGGTDVYAALAAACAEARAFSDEEYTITIVLMTDGQSQGEIKTFAKALNKTTQDIGIFSITFGDANVKQLNQIAQYTGGKVFDGKKDLLSAFRTVRGYS